MRVERGEPPAQTLRNVDDRREAMLMAEYTTDVPGADDDETFADPRWIRLMNRFVLATLKQRARQKPRYLSTFLQYAQELYPEGEPWS